MPARAAENGNLCMVQWLAEKGLPNLLPKVEMYVEVLKFLLSLDCPMAEDDAMMFPAAARSIREDLHQWLLELHCPFMEN
eukprot:gene31887-42532_t